MREDIQGHWGTYMDIEDGLLFHLQEGKLIEPPHKLVLMQFTGLHDKNGKEIWEGDIVKFGETYGDDEFLNPTIHKVTWGGSYPAFDLKPSTDMEINTFSLVYDGAGDSAIEVIGNIYENPDLLSQK
jgi:uncharacterized phage protein (TIGR01671 family)